MGSDAGNGRLSVKTARAGLLVMLPIYTQWLKCANRIGRVPTTPFGVWRKPAGVVGSGGLYFHMKTATALFRLVRQGAIKCALGLTLLLTALSTVAVAVDSTGSNTTTGATSPALGTAVDLTGTLEVVQVCYVAPPRSERWYRLTEDKTG